MHVKISKIILTLTNEYFAELKYVVSKSLDPADYKFPVGMKPIDDEDGLVYVTMRLTVRKGYIMPCRRLVTTANSSPMEDKWLPA